MFDVQEYIRPKVCAMPAYEPIFPPDVLADRLGLPVEAIIKLDANENPYGPAPAVKAAMAELAGMHIYPDPESCVLRQALARFHNLPPENLMAGAGADELIDLIMRLVLTPGDTVLNCPPTFGMYAFCARMNGARLVTVPRRRDFTLDLEAINEAVSRHAPKLLFLASPNNPDGSLLPVEVIEQLLTLPVLLVLDEAYVEFAPAGSSLLQQVPSRANLIVLRTFSKWAGLAGMRVGYGAFPSTLMAQLWKIKPPYNVSVAAATAALASLQQAAYLARIGSLIIAERERLYGALCKIPWLQPYPSQANFILCRVIGRDAAALRDELAQAGILVRYFNQPGLADHVRISVGKPEQTDRLLDELKRRS